jgi:hypothetical protein
VQLLNKRYSGALDESGREWMGFIVEATVRMQSLINDLLMYSRVGTLEKALSLTDISKVMTGVLVDIGSLVEQTGAKITTATLPTVMGDQVQLTQLFQNLIGNAIKYRGESVPVVDIDVKCSKGFWTFSIKDNGIGMESKYYERVFMIFQRLHTRSKYQGTGMGLALCKRIVERHGGKIWVESEPDKGSTFYFTLPAMAKG